MGLNVVGGQAGRAFSGNVQYVKTPSRFVAIQTDATDGIMGVPLTNTDDFEVYAGSSAPTVTKKNGWVEFDATYRAKKADMFPTVENALQIGIIPVDYRPRSKKIFVCQGSGTERWALAVYPGGEFFGSRYSGVQNAGSWLPTHGAWFAQ